MRRTLAAWACIVALGWMLGAASSRAEDIVPSRFYAGAAFNWVHHTGYVPGAVTQADVAQYAIGGKAFAGTRINEYVQFEAAYHHLGHRRPAVPQR